MCVVWTILLLFKLKGSINILKRHHDVSVRNLNIIFEIYTECQNTRVYSVHIISRSLYIYIYI